VPLIEATPLSDLALPASTYALPRESAALWGDEPALSVITSIERWREPLELTFAELLGRVRRAANLLTRLGVQRQDAVGIVATNTSRAILVLLAGEAAGIAAPVNPGLAADKLAALITASGPACSSPPAQSSTVGPRATHRPDRGFRPRDRAPAAPR
jgi:fatty-acyl-CoA synthase